MGETRGRKAETPGIEPLDPLSSIAALRTLAAVRERERWSYRKAAEEVSNFGRSDKGRDRARATKFEPDFEFDDNTLYRAIRNNRPPYDAASKAIWLWADANEQSLYLEIYMEEQLAAEEGLVSSLKEALGHGPDFDFEKVAAFSGTYRLYRPHHLKPKQAVIVSKLTIGDGDSLFDCTLESRFEDEFGDERRDFAEGKIVPHGPRMMAILTSPSTARANFFLYFDDVDHVHEETSAVRKMGGILLSAAGSNAASAWPIYARRVANGGTCEPATLTLQQLANLPKVVQDRLDRGAVYWRSLDFPRPFAKAIEKDSPETETSPSQ